MSKRAVSLWQLNALTPSEAACIRLWSEGNADPHQQRIAYQAVVHKLCLIGESAYAHGEDGRRATDFRLGRQWVGHTLQNLLRVRPAVDPRGAPPPMPADPNDSEAQG